MTKPFSTVLVGSGGFGATYVKKFLDNETDDFALMAIVDPFAANSSEFDRFNGVYPVYETLEEFFGTGAEADFVIIATPIHLHYGQCITALENGAHVLCEKPIVPTIKELDALEFKAKEAGKTLSVGFQSCYSEAILGLKTRIIKGDLGKPISLKTAASWPREHAYYSRNSWAGKVKTDDGQTIYDSVISNATSHYIHNMLFLLGGDMESSAMLENAEVEVYRANDIESFDTCFLRGDAYGTSVYYATSHATNHLYGPTSIYCFENATVLKSIFDQNHEIVIHYKNGKIENLGGYSIYGSNEMMNKIAKSLNGLMPPVCTPHTVRPFTALVEAIFTQAPVNVFPNDYIVTNDKQTYVKHLHIDLMECFAGNKLPSELMKPWAKEPVRLNT